MTSLGPNLLNPTPYTLYPILSALSPKHCTLNLEL